jgi:hypothetical protein
MTTFEKINIVRFWKTMPYAMPERKTPSIKRRVIRGLFLGMLLSSICVDLTVAAENKTSVSHSSPPLAAQKAASPLDTTPVTETRPKRANFKQEPASQESKYLADWVVDSGDNQNMPFLIIDKKQAKVFVFDTNGKLHGAAPVLLGSAQGDNSIPGIGKMALSSIKPTDRTTPAGRFVASLGRDSHNKEILWVDYDLGIALHRVVTTQPKERRLQRLDAIDPLEHRISYGCINVPIKFYDNVVSPAFTKTNGIVYVLPEIRLAHEVFGSYDVEDHAHEQVPVQPAPTQIATPVRR